ncbi:hypothetical protein B0T11DRAFT_108929 [Plectosphaerella cucumerina]|uniref:Uncharacterized protein n=1 Tax=Plectosphaerella cucumerina TaxID=40658 RepID=A0A8K0TI36_9PEZI|nr:hypothetical protein B0T11DRAFT_108929 [Plectosphaerella cucumerina]
MRLQGQGREPVPTCQMLVEFWHCPEEVEHGLLAAERREQAGLIQDGDVPTDVVKEGLEKKPGACLTDRRCMRRIMSFATHLDLVNPRKVGTGNLLEPWTSISPTDMPPVAKPSPSSGPEPAHPSSSYELKALKPWGTTSPLPRHQAPAPADVRRRTNRLCCRPTHTALRMLPHTLCPAARVCGVLPLGPVPENPCVPAFVARSSRRRVQERVSTH